MNAEATITPLSLRERWNGFDFFHGSFASGHP
jgi:hypothetical protein